MVNRLARCIRDFTGERRRAVGADVDNSPPRCTTSHVPLRVLGHRERLRLTIAFDLWTQASAIAFSFTHAVLDWFVGLFGTDRAYLSPTGAALLEHETYRVAAGAYECIYVNMPRFGLAYGRAVVEASELGWHYCSGSVSSCRSSCSECRSGRPSCLRVVTVSDRKGTSSLTSQASRGSGSRRARRVVPSSSWRRTSSLTARPSPRWPHRGSGRSPRAGSASSAASSGRRWVGSISQGS